MDAASHPRDLWNHPLQATLPQRFLRLHQHSVHHLRTRIRCAAWIDDDRPRALGRIHCIRILALRVHVRSAEPGDWCVFHGKAIHGTHSPAGDMCDLFTPPHPSPRLHQPHKQRKWFPIHQGRQREGQGQLVASVGHQFFSPLRIWVIYGFHELVHNI
jgi:hypothetical protein